MDRFLCSEAGLGGYSFHWPGGTYAHHWPRYSLYLEEAEDHVESESTGTAQYPRQTALEQPAIG